MGCTHPFGIEPINRDGKLIGGRCLACGSVAYIGESFWTTIKRNLLGMNIPEPETSDRA